MRALVAFALLAGFYVVTLTIALALLLAPVAPQIVEHFEHPERPFSPPIIPLIIMAWVPAFALLWGLVSVRPPKTTLPGRLLDPAQAPGLFALLDELAASAGTRPPTKIHLTHTTAIAVTEVGGFFGFGSTRVLIIGLPLL
ncbi:MAG TPA: M48 family metallopeptidase, partial [Polyangiaceae bacterium]